MKGYKGFSPGLICRGKQYAENTVFEEETAKICESGMHFCAFPFDVWRFYPPCDKKGNINEFTEVEALDEAETNDEIKYCTKKLKIGAKLKLADFIQAGVEFILEKSQNKTETNTGDQSAATNTGDYSAATVSGLESFAISTGIDGKAKGNLGCYIALAEWKRNDDNEWHVADFKTAKVDGEQIKPDTWYKLIDGKFVEQEEAD